MITKYGYSTIAVVTAVTLGGSLIVWNLVDHQVIRIATVLLLLGFFGLTLNFFRDPERLTPDGENLVIAPADGKVVKIQELREDEFLKEEAVQVSIFMSPLNVHVNRFPINGTVSYYRYVPGEYLVAFDDKSSLRNERTHIGVENGKHKVFFKQIAGFVARRIVAEVEKGTTARAGARFGMIRFGSRVDVFFPRNSQVKVREGETTIAGTTVLAELS